MSESKKVTKEMQEYANEQMVRLIENISRNPIECYSMKEKGSDPKYFLGRSYVETLISQIKKTKT